MRPTRRNKQVKKAANGRKTILPRQRRARPRNNRQVMRVPRRVNMPSAIQQYTPTAPSGTFVISREELVASFSGAPDNNNITDNAYYLNPGVYKSFPWLSGIASSYERFRLESVIYEWRPSCGTSESGSIVMTTEFDSRLRTYTSLQDAASNSGSIRCTVWSPQSYVVPVRQLQTLREYEIVNNTESSTALSSLSSPGGFHFVFSGTSGGFSGELWVKYRIRLIHAISGQPPASDYEILQSATVSAGEFVYPADGVINVQRSLLPNSIYPISGGTGIFRFTEPGKYFVSVFMDSSLPITGASFSSTDINVYRTKLFSCTTVQGFNTWLRVNSSGASFVPRFTIGATPGAWAATTYISCVPLSARAAYQIDPDSV